MPYEFDTSAAIFDRTDLRTLRAAYECALARLQTMRVMDKDAKTELARLVLHLGRERGAEGTGLRYRDADTSIADEASGFLGEWFSMPLVA